jgi:hypothetical protein
MKFDITAPITGATIYRIKFPLPVTIFGPSVLAGFILAPVESPKQNDSNATMVPTPSDSLNRLTFLLTSTCIEYIRSRVIAISIPHAFGIETVGIVAPSTTSIAASQAPSDCAIKYPGNAFCSRSPFAANAIDTAGLIWAPEIGWKIIIAVNTAKPKVTLIAIGLQPIATDPHPNRTIRKVPQNSAR